MKILLAKSCGKLFAKCICFQTILVFVFYILNEFAPESSIAMQIWIYFITDALQLVIGLFTGLYIRKINKILLREDSRKKRRYTIISLVVTVVLLTLTLFPNVFIVMLYFSIGDILNNAFGVDRIITAVDLLSIGVCLCTVFFSFVPRQRPRDI